MKKFKETIKRIYSILLLAFSDNYLVMTYDQKQGTKYDFEYRSNFHIGNDLMTDMNYAVFSWIMQHHEKRQAEVNDDTINKLLNK